MNFTVNKTDLVRELALAVGACEKRTTIPILAHVKLDLYSSPGNLAITATDLELAINCSCPASIADLGAVTVSAKRLLDCVRLLPEGDIKFSVSANQFVTVKAGRSRSQMPGMSAESFPEIPTGGKEAFTLTMGTLKRLAERSLYAISHEESRFTLNGALFGLSDAGLAVVATDGHRISLSRESVLGDAITLLVPRKALAEVIRLADSTPATESVTVSHDDNHIYFRAGTRSLTSRKLSGNFPDYKRAIPEGHPGCATINRKALVDAVKRVAAFADERLRAIRIKIDGQDVALFASAVESGESHETIDAVVTEGSALEIGFNASYLLDFLGSTDAESINLRFADGKSAVRLSPSDDEDGYVSVIMPLRLA